MALTTEAKKKILQERIKALKVRSAPITFQSISIEVRGARGGSVNDKLAERVVCGYLIAWGNKNMYGQKCVKGSCAKSIRERGPNSTANYKITFLWQHRQDDPLAVFAVLEEDDFGLYFETKPLDEVPNAERTLKQILSKTLNQFSVGFDYIWDKIEYDETDDSLVLLEIDLFEGSVVTIGADGETFATARRSADYIESLHDETEDYINTLPRQHRNEARKLFARHKALIEMEPGSDSNTLQEEKPPNEKSINYKVLNNYFKKQLNSQK